MKRFKDLSVGTKFTIKIISILIAVLIACFAPIILITSQNNESQAKNGAQSLAGSDAATVEAEMEVPLDAARAIAQSMQGFENLNAADRRDIYNNIMKSFIQDNPVYLGIWTCWEPNALDNMDDQLKNSEGTDDSGRYIPYWYYDNGQVTLTALTGYTEPGSGDYYLLAKNSGQETILEPYEYEVGGKTVLLTSVAVPVKDKNGNVVAVTGIDMTLESLQSMTFNKGGFETAYVNIVSNSGIFVYHDDAKFVGKNIKEVRADSSTLDAQAQAVSSGQPYTCEDTSVSKGTVVKRFFTPIKIGQTATPWSVEVVVDTSEIMKQTNEMTLLLAGLLIGVTIFGVIVVALMIRASISKPIKKIAVFAKALAAGDLSASVEKKSQDEIGQLTDVLDINVRQAFKDVQDASLVAEKRAEYQSAEVDKLLVNLQRLARGELNCDIVVAQADEVTKDQYTLFSEIADNLHGAISEIKKYIGEISMVLSDMSNGNLDVGITAAYKGEFTALKDSINGIAASFNKMLSEINLSADQVASGTRQVSDGSQAISQGATEQASAIEELTATVNQIAEQTRQNAMSANQANDLTTDAAKEAALGNERMVALQNAMAQINEASESIGKIIKVIDDIAFQTNILALNAAVEAARAGVHGKGFAVVAEEVRNLAARSAQAAKETTALIEGSVAKTEAGTKIADETAQALVSIVSGVDKAAQLVAEIARASGEQAGAITQVDNGIEQMNQVVQNNSATSEETAAAAEELSSQAEMLKSMVGRFKLRDTDSGDAKPFAAGKSERLSAPAVEPKIDLDTGFGKY